MKNYEKYGDKIKNFTGNFCKDFIEPYILKAINNAKCYDISCAQCNMLRTLWLLEEYEEPKIDWLHMKLDTPILVRQNENSEWVEGYFANYDNETETIYTWKSGGTSWTTYEMDKWQYAKLIEYEELEFGWDKWKVDTPILVRDFIYDEWEKRYFAKYEDGNIYAWSDGKTSWTAEGVMTEWEYAKLAESEKGGVR